jgi:hypothetical protein
MAFDDRRGNNHRGKQDPNKYQERNGNYSPSARYLFGGNSQPPQHVQHQNQSHRRDKEQHKQAQQFERLAKQNDIMIRLLKEVRDKLDELVRVSRSSNKGRKPSANAGAERTPSNGRATAEKVPSNGNAADEKAPVDGTMVTEKVPADGESAVEQQQPVETAVAHASEDGDSPQDNAR